MRHAILVLLLSTAALAAPPTAPVTNVQAFTASTEVLTAVALNAAAATRTVTIVTGKLFSGLLVDVRYTYSAATTVTVTPTCTHDGTNYVSMTTASISGGARTLSVLADTYTTGGASAALGVSYDVSACQAVKLVFGGASAGAGDLVTVRAFGVVGY